MKRLLAVLLAAACGASSYGMGLGGGVWLDSLDITKTKEFVLGLMEDMGIPPDELGDIEASMVAELDYLPVPTIGGFFSVDAGIGSLEFEGAFVSDRLLRVAGLLPPGPIDIGEPGEVPITVDLELVVFRLALGWHPRLDVGLFAAGVGIGAAMSGGGLEAVFASPDPEVQAHLPHIPPGSFSWFAAGPMLWADLELGLPFLRLFARGNLFVPFARSSGEAELRPGNLGGAVGLVVRF